MNQSKTILFFGNERLATGVTTQTPVIKALVSNGYNVAAVVTTSVNYTASSRKPRKLEIAEQAEKFNIPVLEFSRLKDSIEQLKSYGAEVGVLAAYGKMVPQSVIDIFPKGIVNIHPSLLPLHRGPTPLESVILSGEDKTGVSLMQLVSDMDAGPVYKQEVLALTGNESKQELADKLGLIGASMLIEVLPQIIDGTIKPLAQSGPVSYDKRLEASFSALDANKPATTLEREIRAYKGWPRSKLVFKSQPLIITSAHVVEGNTAKPGEYVSINGSLALTTSSGTLVIDSLIPAGGKEMSGQAYLLGRPL